MSKKDTSYSDAMNEWAAKQSFIRNRKNRFIHPNPELPAPIQALGYLFRLAVVVFVFGLIVVKLSKKYYHGPAFSEDFRAEIQEFVDAKEIDAAGFGWTRGKAVSKRIKATGTDSAFYRDFNAERVGFEVPLWRRLRNDWDIDHLSIEYLTLDLKSGGKMHSREGAALEAPRSPGLMHAGIFPSPKLDGIKIKRITCTDADFSWGLSRATLGAVENAGVDMYSASPNWRLDLSGGQLRQNWLRGLEIDSLTVRREDQRLVLSHSEVRLGSDKKAESGTLEGHVTLERLPKLDLKLELPHASTRDLLPKSITIPEYFYGDVSLSMQFTGSINTLAGVETNGKMILKSGTFDKIPALEAIDKLLKTSSYRMFSPEEGEAEFSTSDGKLKVSRFECRSKGGYAILRGEFTFTPAITSGEAAVSNATGIGETGRIQARSDNISGKLQLGVRPARIAKNEIAKRYFKERAEGYVWMEIPLNGPIHSATKALQAEVLAALKIEG